MVEENKIQDKNLKTKEDSPKAEQKSENTPSPASAESSIGEIISKQLDSMNEIFETRLREIEKKLEDMEKSDEDSDQKKIIERMDKLEKKMSRFIGLYELVTNKYNPFMEHSEDCTQDSITSPQHPVQEHIRATETSKTKQTAVQEQPPKDSGMEHEIHTLAAGMSNSRQAPQNTTPDKITDIKAQHAAKNIQEMTGEQEDKEYAARAGNASGFDIKKTATDAADMTKENGIMKERLLHNLNSFVDEIKDNISYMKKKKMLQENISQEKEFLKKRLDWINQALDGAAGNNACRKEVYEKDMQAAEHEDEMHKIGHILKRYDSDMWSGFAGLTEHRLK